METAERTELAAISANQPEDAEGNEKWDFLEMGKVREETKGAITGRFFDGAGLGRWG